MRDLGTLVGCCSDPSDINARGQVTGTMYYDGSLNQHAFLWDGDMIDLGTVPGDAGSRAIAINARGQVAGESYTDKWADLIHPFLWDRGVMQPLWGPDDREHLFDRVTALNDLGQVVGYRDNRPQVSRAPWASPFCWISPATA